MTDNGKRNRVADHSRIARAADDPRLKLAGFALHLLITVLFAIGGWFAIEVWEGQKDANAKIDSVKLTVSNLSLSTAVIQEQYETLGLVVQDHETRIRQVERAPALPWGGRRSQ